MLCYKDRSYCGSQVEVHTCGREITPEEAAYLAPSLGWEEEFDKRFQLDGHEPMIWSSGRGYSDLEPIKSFIASTHSSLKQRIVEKIEKLRIEAGAALDTSQRARGYNHALVDVIKLIEELK